MIPAVRKKTTVVIESCSQCPNIMVYIDAYPTTGEISHKCTKKRPFKEIIKTYDIPEWCPLEDYK